MTRGLERERIRRSLIVAELVGALQQINGQIRELHRGSRNTLRPKISPENLHREKHRLILKLLEQRRQAIRWGDLGNPAAKIKIEVRVRRYPGEEFHPSSENEVQVGGWLPNRKRSGSWQTKTFLHQLATSGNLGNSLVVLGLIGEPTDYLEESADSYVKRTFSESKRIDAILYKVRTGINNCYPGLEKDRLVLEGLKIALAIRLLTMRVYPPDLLLDSPIEVSLLRDSGPKGADLVQICWRGKHSLRIFPPERYPPEIGTPLASLIEAGGGYNFEGSRKDENRG